MLMRINQHLEKKEPLHTVDGNINWCYLLWKTVHLGAMKGAHKQPHNWGLCQQDKDVWGASGRNTHQLGGNTCWCHVRLWKLVTQSPLHLSSSLNLSVEDQMTLLLTNFEGERA